MLASIMVWNRRVSVSARVGSWSKAVCAISSEPGPMSRPPAAKTLVNGLAVDLIFCGVLASLQRHLEHKVNPETVAEIRAL